MRCQFMTGRNRCPKRATVKVYQGDVMMGHVCDLDAEELDHLFGLKRKPTPAASEGAQEK